MLSVIIPTHNEEHRIKGTLRLLTDFLEKNRVAYEIIIVDDGDDDTAKIIAGFMKSNKKIQLHHAFKRMGKGGAIVKGMREAKGDALIYDADASTPPREIVKITNALETADLAIGSRKLPGSIVNGLPLTRVIASALFSLIVNTLFHLGVRDTQCGFKAIKKSAYKKLLPEFVSTGFEWDVELIARARKNGMRIVEVPIEWTHRGGSKMRFTDSIRILNGVLRLKKTLE